MHSALGKMMESDYAFPRAPPRSLSLFFLFIMRKTLFFYIRAQELVFI
jgi:hypothetical protein